MPEASKDNYVVGIDLGGTKILAGLFDGSLECIGTAKVSTKAQRGMETVISRIERCVRDAVDEADLGLKQVAGIGIGAPRGGGFLKGAGIFFPELDGVKKGALKKEIEKQNGRPGVVGESSNNGVLCGYVS